MHIIYTKNTTRRKDGGTKPAAEQDQENPRASLANSRGNPTQERKGRGTQHSKQALENLLRTETERWCAQPQAPLAPPDIE